MDDLFQSLFPHAREQGIKDYDDLTPVERDEYQKMLKIQESGTISLEDFKRHVHAMRQSVEYELAKLPNNDEKNTGLKARLMNYLLFESFFDKPERARQLLEQYKQHP